MTAAARTTTFALAIASGFGGAYFAYRFEALLGMATTALAVAIVASSPTRGK